MELWDEESLAELAKKRQGGLDIPEWEENKNLSECKKCGYSLRAGWNKCPVCETPVGEEPKIEPVEQTPHESNEESSEENTEEKESNSQDSSPGESEE